MAPNQRKPKGKVAAKVAASSRKSAVASSSKKSRAVKAEPTPSPPISDAWGSDVVSPPAGTDGAADNPTLIHSDSDEHAGDLNPTVHESSFVAPAGRDFPVTPKPKRKDVEAPSSGASVPSSMKKRRVVPVSPVDVADEGRRAESDSQAAHDHNLLTKHAMDGFITGLGQVNEDFILHRNFYRGVVWPKMAELVIEMEGLRKFHCLNEAAEASKNVGDAEEPE